MKRTTKGIAGGPASRIAGEIVEHAPEEEEVMRVRPPQPQRDRGKER